MIFNDYCEWKYPDNASDYAKSCDCGSVKFNLLLTGEIECCGCGVKLPGRKWFKEGCLN